MANANTVCDCGARYSAFRSMDCTGHVLTFATVREMLRVSTDDSEMWNNRSRGAVLRFWSFLKRAQWEAMHGYCAAVLAADATVETMPEWVTDSTVVDVGYTGDDEAEIAVATVEISNDVVSTLTNQSARVIKSADDAHAYRRSSLDGFHLRDGVGSRVRFNVARWTQAHDHRPRRCDLRPIRRLQLGRRRQGRLGRDHCPRRSQALRVTL